METLALSAVLRRRLRSREVIDSLEFRLQAESNDGVLVISSPNGGASAIERSNATATTIHPGPGRFGGGFDSLELSLSAGQAAPTQRQRKQPADSATFAATNIDGYRDADTATGAISGPSSGACDRQYSATKDSRHHAAL